VTPGASANEARQRTADHCGLKILDPARTGAPAGDGLDDLDVSLARLAEAGNDQARFVGGDHDLRPVAQPQLR